MAQITKKEWLRYIALLRRLDDRAAAEMRAFITPLKAQYDAGAISSKFFRQALIEQAYMLATKYGEGAGEAACEMYDAIAALQGVSVPTAVPAQTATIEETARAVNGTLKTGNADIVADSVGRLVKMAGVDTMLQNAIRDGAQFAWIPSGDTCAFCITLASRGWQRASKNAIKNGHAEHVHANCDCTYAVRFSDDMDVEGYEPQGYLKLYEESDGSTPQERINALRRDFYNKNKEIINEQKRSAYAKRIERDSSGAEEINVD